MAECYADASLSKLILNWEAKFCLEEMVREHWNWQSKNPYGYNKK